MNDETDPRHRHRRLCRDITLCPVVCVRCRRTQHRHPRQRPGRSIPIGSISLPVISIARVTVFGLRHTWSGDLTARLSGPGGTVDLYNRTGKTSAVADLGSSTDLGTGGANDTALEYTFTSGGANLWSAATGETIAPGTFARSSNVFGGSFTSTYVETILNTVAGGTGGAFTLTFVDAATGFEGSSDGFEIEAVPEPANATLGLGALKTMRLRRDAPS